VGSSFRKALTGTRYSAGSNVDGHWVEGGATALNFTASVQPIRPEEMSLVPENRRDTARFALFTDTRLLTADDEGATNADRVTIDGIQYEVFACDIWQNDVIPHYRVLVATVKELAAP
jgi:hypothetical protein